MRIVLLISFLVLTVWPVPGVAANRGGSGTADQSSANEIVVRRAFKALEQGDVATLNRVFDPKGLIHSTSGKTFVQGGPFSNLKDSCSMCAKLGKRKITIDLMVAQGNMVAVRSTWTGSYSGVVNGIKVENKQVSVVYTNFYRIADGKIAENWFEVDSLSLAKLLGFRLMPSSKKPD